MKAFSGLQFLTCVCVPVLLFTGCITSSITPTGSEPRLAPSDPSSIVVFDREESVGKAFKTLGLLNYKNPGKYQRLTLQNAIQPLKEQASSLGANGIIIDKHYIIRSGMISTGIGVEARAIRF
jgi:hypothetical protein